jgi:hypothetical protein
MKNENVNKRFSIKKEIAYDIFGKHNLLRGTSYYDWVTYLNSAVNLPKIRSKKNVMVNPLQRAYSRLAFRVNGTTIMGTSNKDTIMKLANHIGPFALSQI